MSQKSHTDDPPYAQRTREGPAGPSSALAILVRPVVGAEQIAPRLRTKPQIPAQEMTYW